MEAVAQQNLPHVFRHYDIPPENDPKYDATHDELTGLLNRRGLSQALNYLESQMPGNFAVIALDLDELKATNDTHGHDEGDKLLWNTGVAIMESVRTRKGPVSSEYYNSRYQQSRGNETNLPDIVGSRPGGDEFVVILPGVEDEEDARIVENRIQDNLRSVGVSASSGIAQHEPGMTPRHLSGLADRRMFAQKRNKQKQTHQEAFNALPKHKKLIARFGDACIRYAGVRPPKNSR